MAARQPPTHSVTVPSHLNFLSLSSPSLTGPSLWYGYQLSHTHTLILGHFLYSQQHVLSDPPSSWSLSCSTLLKYLPIGVNIVGVHMGTLQSTESPPPLDKLISSLQHPDTLSIPTHSFLLSDLSAPHSQLSFQLIHLPTGDLSPVSLSYQHISCISKLVQEFVIQFEIRHELNCQVSPDSFYQDLSSQIDLLKQELNSETSASLFSVRTGSKSKPKDICLPLPSPVPFSKTKKTASLLKESFPPWPDPYPLTLTTTAVEGDYIIPLHYNTWLPYDLPLHQLVPVLKEGVHRYLTAITDLINIPSMPPCNVSLSLIPHPMLPFLPLSLPLPHTHLHTNSPIDPLTLPLTRQHLNTLLSLPSDLPYFFSHRGYPPPCLQLVAPHFSLSTPLPPDYTLVRSVTGLYDYYHYMSGGVDDSGWGCAYRSLQTIFSWYLLQGYVRGRDTPPSHTEIQESLVYLGDKPSTLIGSRQWIGSVEIGMVLQDMLGVEYKIIPLSSANELAETARQLLHHFEKVGTPVMIGGGERAYTILGCAYDENMGTCQLLVLDPHYKGQADLKSILKGGWCAWRGVKFWKPNTFYNLCLPLRKFIL